MGPAKLDAAVNEGAEPTRIEKFPLVVLYDGQRQTFTDELPQLTQNGGKQLVDRDRFTDFGKLLDSY